MKITTKTTKEQLRAFIGANVKAVKKQDKDLFDRIDYADKMAKKDESKVTRKDLADLAKEVIALLGDAVSTPALQPVAENATKKLAKGVSKKQEFSEPEETVAEESSESDETAEATEKVDKKSAKKSVGKKEKKAKKDGVTALEGTDNPKTVQMAKVFPQTLEVEGTKFELANDIESMEDLYNAISNDEEIMFAYYWTKRHLKQFPYFSGLLGQPKSFPDDLDLATAIYVSDEFKVSYQTSRYTEAIYTIVPDDFEVENGVRFAGGIEFQIYRAV